MANQYTKKTDSTPKKSTPLVSKAEELQKVKNEILSTAAKLAKTAIEGASLQSCYDGLIAQHKKLQDELKDEALLVKGE